MPVRFTGAPLLLEWAGPLRAWRGRLHLGKGPGQPVHAASFLRRRWVVLDRELADDPDELARVALHEIFHFVWIRLNNGERRRWEHLIAGETAAGARGELGWSAEWRRNALRQDDLRRRSRRWRDYVCESFCDTAAWAFAGLRSHDEFTLPARYRKARRRLLDDLIRHRGGVLPV